MIAPVGAIVAAKVLPIGYVESAETKLKRWFKPRPSLQSKYPSGLVHHAPLPAGGIWSDGFMSDMRAKHQHELTMWLKNRVDQAAFEMMKGDLDGKV